MNTEKLIDWLKDCDVSKTSEDTGIPKDRIYKWRQGKGTPKTEDYNTLVAYHNKLSGITSNIINEPETPYTTKSLLQQLSTKWGNYMSSLVLKKDEKELQKIKLFSCTFVMMKSYVNTL